MQKRQEITVSKEKYTEFLKLLYQDDKEVQKTLSKFNWGQSFYVFYAGDLFCEVTQNISATRPKSKIIPLFCIDDCMNELEWYKQYAHFLHDLIDKKMKKIEWT